MFLQTVIKSCLLISASKFILKTETDCCRTPDGVADSAKSRNATENENEN